MDTALPAYLSARQKILEASSTDCFLSYQHCQALIGQILRLRLTPVNSVRELFSGSQRLEASLNCRNLQVSSHDVAKNIAYIVATELRICAFNLLHGQALYLM